MKNIHFALPAFVLIAPMAIGATYFNDFEGAVDDSDLASAPGWTVNDPSDQYSAFVPNTPLDIDNPTTTSKALNIGDASLTTLSPTGSLVSYSRPAVGMVGATAVAFDFLLDDSYEPGFEDRDTFGFSFSNGLGNMIAIEFVPAQATSPDVSIVGDASWGVFYRLGNGGRQALQMNQVGVPGGPSRSIVEARRHDLAMTLTPNTSNLSLTNLVLTIRNISPTDPSNSGFATIVGSTTLNLNSVSDTGSFQLNWAKSDGNSSFGSNSLWVDNLSVVPEPSAALLSCIAGIGLVLRRRRA